MERWVRSRARRTLRRGVRYGDGARRWLERLRRRALRRRDPRNRYPLPPYGDGRAPRVVIVAEYYPRAADPVLGVWAHRQALAARDAGADVRVVVLHRPIPSLAAVRSRSPAALLDAFRQPRTATLDGIEIRYLHYLSPPRPGWYASWGAFAAPQLRLALRNLQRRWPFDLVHAHYAAPAGDAVRRANPHAPMVVSVHGGDVYGLAEQSPAGRAAVSTALAHARLVMANSHGTLDRARQLGARRARVVRLGTDIPSQRPQPLEATDGDRPPAIRAAPATRASRAARSRLNRRRGRRGRSRGRAAVAPRPGARTDAPVQRITTVSHLVSRKRHGDVLRAVWILRDTHPRLVYTIVGDGPERDRLERLARELGIDERVEFTGRLEHAEAVRVGRLGQTFVLPSIDEAFGVAYVEAMAAGIPAIGCRGEAGPEEIAAAATALGLEPGIRLVPPGDPEALAGELRQLLDDRAFRKECGEAARRTVEAAFTWQACGRATVAAYRAALGWADP